jgi:hypothetical protein
MPVLIDDVTGCRCGPTDIIIKPDYSGLRSYEPAAVAVKRQAQSGRLTENHGKLVERFTATFDEEFAQNIAVAKVRCANTIGRHASFFGSNTIPGVGKEYKGPCWILKTEVWESWQDDISLYYALPNRSSRVVRVSDEPSKVTGHYEAHDLPLELSHKAARQWVEEQKKDTGVKFKIILACCHEDAFLTKRHLEPDLHTWGELDTVNKERLKSTNDEIVTLLPDARKALDDLKPLLLAEHGKLEDPPPYAFFNLEEAIDYIETFVVGTRRIQGILRQKYGRRRNSELRAATMAFQYAFEEFEIAVDYLADCKPKYSPQVSAQIDSILAYRANLRKAVEALDGVILKKDRAVVANSESTNGEVVKL